MTDNAIKSHGCVLSMGAGDGDPSATPPVAETFTAVAYVGDIKGPNKVRSTIETTTHDSPDDYEEFVTTVKSPGEVTFPINRVFSDAAHAALEDAFESGVKGNWKLTEPDATEDPTELAFAAACTGLNLDNPVHGVITSDITLKLSGKPVLTAHSEA